MANKVKFVAKFEKKNIFNHFIKAPKEYLFQENIPHSSCICEVCENGSFWGNALKAPLLIERRSQLMPHYN